MTEISARVKIYEMTISFNRVPDTSVQSARGGSGPRNEEAATYQSSYYN
jgi:hypothetical protein